MELDCSISGVKLKIVSKDAAIHVTNSLSLWTIKKIFKYDLIKGKDNKL